MIAQQKSVCAKFAHTAADGNVGLAALALLVAESDPKAKDVMIRLIEHMLAPRQTGDH